MLYCFKNRANTLKENWPVLQVKRKKKNSLTSLHYLFPLALYNLRRKIVPLVLFASDSQAHV